MDVLGITEALDRAANGALEPAPVTVHELEADEILKACGFADTVRLKPGEFLFREGEEARHLYVVKSGAVRVMSGSTVYEIVKVGGIVGEMAIIDQDMPRSANVIAGARTELAMISADEFLSLVRDTPSFALTLLKVVTRRLRVMNQRYRTGR